jgi:bifunctional non-homologous end joining protein LigD
VSITTRIVKVALKNRSNSFVIDGEAVLLGVDGLHSRQNDVEVQLYAFDCLALDGDDLRKLPLSLRKTNLARLLARRPDGIFVSDFEQGEIGPDLFRKACEFGLEGLVSKRRDGVYRAGTSPNRIKVKTRLIPRCNASRTGFVIGSKAVAGSRVAQKANWPTRASYYSPRKRLPAALCSERMEHRGVSYSLVEEQPGVWRWRVLIGNPQMLRMGEAASQRWAVASAIRH